MLRTGVIFDLSLHAIWGITWLTQVRDLQENILKPRLLRRLKEDVEKSIPLKEEVVSWCQVEWFLTLKYFKLSA